MITGIPTISERTGDAERDITVIYRYLNQLTQAFVSAPGFASDPSIQQDSSDSNAFGYTMVEPDDSPLSLFIPGPQGGQGLQGISGFPGIDAEEPEIPVPLYSTVNQWPIGSVFLSVVSTNPAILIGFGVWAAFGAGKVLVGLDSTDVDFDTVEETGGVKTVTLTVAQMPVHTHVQDAHTHVQDSHNHTQNAHTHVQDSHTHVQQVKSTDTAGIVGSQGSGTANDTSVGITDATIAVNQTATATNNAVTATNQSTVAVNQNTGGGTAHTNLQPYIVVYMWKRTA